MKRANWFVLLSCVVALVNDGWSGRPTPLTHQIILLPLSALFVFSLVKLLSHGDGERLSAETPQPRIVWLWVCILFELVSLLGFSYEARHFAQFGYHVPAWGFVVLLIFVAASWLGFLRSRSANRLIGGVVGTYAAGAVLAIFCFPLNYLRSDMLPVIVWADRRLAGHLNPYLTMHVGARIYDFPYLPGMLVAYLPVVALHLDPRWFNALCVLAGIYLLYETSKPAMRKLAATLIAVFVLSPFLQYRHDLYLEPHWLTLVAAIVLLQKRRYTGGAVVFGISMALYQLSWVLWPFLLLFGLRRGGWREVIRSGTVSLAAMMLVIGPFVSSAMSRIANNTVGQWSRLPHALADPINLSYWVTYFVRPDRLQWVQLAALSALFAFCLVRGCCRTLEDTLRWMSAGLALFIGLNVLVDGYFYLTLLLLLLMYTLSTTGIWARAEDVDSLSPRPV